MTTMTVQSPALVAEPRGARWAAQAAVGVLEVLNQAGRRWRAHREAANRLGQAAAVRRLAASWQDIDPRFAADLFAADAGPA